MSNLQAIQKIEALQDGYIARQQMVRGKIGRRNGITATLRSNYCWVRLFYSRQQTSQLVQAFNRTTDWQAGLDVIVQVNPQRIGGTAPYVVLGTLGNVGTSMSAFDDAQHQQQSVVGSHHKAHEWSDLNVGIDALNIFDRNLVEMRADVNPNGTDMKVYVNPGDYTYLGIKYTFLGGLTPDFIVPDKGTRADLIYLDPNRNVLGVKAGVVATEVTSALTEPAVAGPLMSIAAIYLSRDTASIEERNIQDRRCFISMATPARDILVDEWGDILVDKDNQVIYA